jgi:hypothetical protein
MARGSAMISFACSPNADAIKKWLVSDPNCYRNQVNEKASREKPDRPRGSCLWCRGLEVEA